MLKFDFVYIFQAISAFLVHTQQNEKYIFLKENVEVNNTKMSYL